MSLEKKFYVRYFLFLCFYVYVLDERVDHQKLIRPTILLQLSSRMTPNAMMMINRLQMIKNSYDDEDRTPHSAGIRALVLHVVVNTVVGQ